MNLDEFLELVKKRKMTRTFKPDPIPDECIEKILEAARWAPSARNAQPWEFIVVKDKDTRKRIFEILDGHWDISYAFEKQRKIEVGHPKFLKKFPKPVEAWMDAPVLIVICCDPRAAQAHMLIDSFLPMEGGHQALLFKSMGAATLMIHLAAVAYGLGAGWISSISTTEVALKELLGVPVELSVQTVVPIGYPSPSYKLAPSSSYRRELNEIVHYEKYDPAKYRSGDDIYDSLVNMSKRQQSTFPMKSEP